MGHLISVVVLSYNRLEHLKECVESVLFQTYGNIELIISNDGADEFDIDNTNDLLGSVRRSNVTNVIINKNEKNFGTVKHCNIALDLATGDYIMFIACDDLYSSNTVIADLVNGFKEAPPETMSIVGQTAMYDTKMKKIDSLYVTKEHQQLINDLDPLELYRNHLVLKCVFPAASRIYKKEAFDKFGRFNEKYFLVEDWTSSCEHAKRGMKSYYVDILCVNHRGGGVSHSPLESDNFSQKMFKRDLLTMYQEHLSDSTLSQEMKRHVQTEHNWARFIYDTTFIMPFQSKKDNILFLMKNRTTMKYLLSSRLVVLSKSFKFIKNWLLYKKGNNLRGESIS